MIKNIFCETMQRKTYVSRFCVLLFLIIEDANVNALSLTSCDNPIENTVCHLTCTTTDHEQTVAFDKEPDPSIIAQCDSGFGCAVVSQYSISQPNSVTTVLSFMHSRSNSGTWRCSYGLTISSVAVHWATYPQRVTTTLTSYTTVDTNIEGNVTLECLYSEQAPNVTLQYEDANGNIDATSETFQCDATDIPCTDGNFTKYGCPVVVKEESGIDNSDTYLIKLKIKVSHVQREDVHTIATDITFKRPTTTEKQQTTTDETTTDETTTMETNDGSKDNGITIIIVTVLIVMIIIIIIIIVLINKRGNICDNVKATTQYNSNKTWEPTVNKSDTPEPMDMQHGKPRHHAVNKPGNPGLAYIQNNHHVDYDRRYNSGKPKHVSMPNKYHADYDRRNYSGNPEHEPLPRLPPAGRGNYSGNPEHEPLPRLLPADYDRRNYHDSHLYLSP